MSSKTSVSGNEIGYNRKNAQVCLVAMHRSLSDLASINLHIACRSLALVERSLLGSLAFCHDRVASTVDTLGAMADTCDIDNANATGQAWMADHVAKMGEEMAKAVETSSEIVDAVLSGIPDQLASIRATMAISPPSRPPIARRSVKIAATPPRRGDGSDASWRKAAEPPAGKMAHAS